MTQSLTNAQQVVLRAFGRYPYLSSWQVRDLLYQRDSEASRKYASDLLKQLTDRGLLNPANTYERGAVKGGNKFVWSLTERGRKALDELHYPVLLEVPKRPGRSQEFLGHVRLSTDALICFERFGKEHPDVRIIRRYHELELRQILNPAVLPAIPDGYVSYQVAGRSGTLGIALEADRGTERQFPDPSGAASWDDKVRRLKQLTQSPPEYLPITRVAVVIRSIRKPNPDRLADLLSWTEGAVSDAPAWLDLFRFTIADPQSMTPEAFVSGSHWARYLGNGMREQVPLLAL